MTDTPPAPPGAADPTDETVGEVVENHVLYRLPAYVRRNTSSFTIEKRSIQYPPGAEDWVVLALHEGERHDRCEHRAMLYHLNLLAKKCGQHPDELYFVLRLHVPDKRATALLLPANKAGDYDPDDRWPRVICINQDHSPALRTLVSDILDDLEEGGCHMSLNDMYWGEEMDREVKEYWRDLMTVSDRLKALLEVETDELDAATDDELPEHIPGVHSYVEEIISNCE